MFGFGGNAYDRPVTALLLDTMETDDLNDDWAIAKVGGPLGGVGEAWRGYDFELDLSGSGLPAGWDVFDFNGIERTDWDFDALLADVDQVQFYLGTPDYFYGYEGWDIGADNARMTFAPVPEPSTLALLAGGLVLLGRRRRASSVT